MANRSTLGRLWRHLWCDHGARRRAFPDATLDAIEAAISAGESAQLAEVRFAVEAGLPLRAVWAGRSTHQRALAVFAELNVWDTEQNNGVLLYVSLADRVAEIIVDRDVARRVDNSVWRAIVTELGDAYRAGRWQQGSIQALERINAVLTEHYPAGAQPNPDQLPNRPVVL